MAATPQQIAVTTEQLESTGGGGAYSALEVPADYVATLTDVTDYDNSGRGGSRGWIWIFDIEGLEFKTWTAFSTQSRWKLIEVLEAFGYVVEEGVIDVDPNIFIGAEVGAHVDFQKDPKKADPNEPNYREIKYVFPTEVSAPAPL